MYENKPKIIVIVIIVRNEQYTSQVGTIIHYELGWITMRNQAFKTDFEVSEYRMKHWGELLS